MRKFFVFSIFVVVATASSVFGDAPDPSETIAIMPGVEDEEVVLFVLPDGTGSFFNQAQIRDDGSFIDAHIEIHVKDAFGAPIPNVPKEDLWLESCDGGMVPCVGGTCADSDTDENGFSYWEEPLHASGYSEDCVYVIENGESLNGTPFLLSIVSADFNSDGNVNLADVGLFSSAFFGEYTFSCDLFADGVLSLPDVGRLAVGHGGSCP